MSGNKKSPTAFAGGQEHFSTAGPLMQSPNRIRSFAVFYFGTQRPLDQNAQVGQA
jgi:hypothetical protein